MTDQPATRQELYDRIRATSRDEVVLEEMIRLGFWPDAATGEDSLAGELARQRELHRQLRAMVSEAARLQDIVAVRRALLEQRLAESRRKQQETRQRRMLERQQRAEQWQQRKQREILYLGEDVSEGLNHCKSDTQKLQAHGLPVFATPLDLAQAMGISLGALRFLAFARSVSTTTHYVRFYLPKKTGGQRLISAPMPRLKRAQQWIQHTILEQVALHDAAHGFRRGRSIVTNAAPHVGADVVLNVDLKDFFPTITYRRIRGMFRQLGYSESVATVLALLCSEPEIQEVALDKQTYYVARRERFLPQGAPTSPAITNIICRALDGRLANSAAELGFRYTRYADDITFSGSGRAAENVGRALRRIRYTIEQEGFVVHPDKTRVLRRSRRQEVTGLVVNQRVNVSRKLLRRFRATLFQIERDGPAGKRWGRGGDVIASIEGFANFVAMVDAEKGKRFQQQVERIIERHGRGGGRAHTQRQRWQPKPVAPKPADESEGIVTAEVADQVPPSEKIATPPGKRKKPWWKFW